MANYLKVAFALTAALVVSTTPALAGEVVIGALIAALNTTIVGSITVGSVVGARLYPRQSGAASL
jgi:hypothetical protein